MTKQKLTEVAPSRLDEYKQIEDEVDRRALEAACKELGFDTVDYHLGMCHWVWKHKKRILRNEYHMIWRSPQDLNPDVLFD